MKTQNRHRYIHRALLAPPTFGHRRHRSLARRLVAVRRRAVFVLAVGPPPFRHGLRSVEDAPDHDAPIRENVVIVVAPLAG